MTTTAMNQTVALTHLAVRVVLQRCSVPDAWTTARYRSIQMLRGGAEGEYQRKEEVRDV